jgi:hypothetical protein
VFLPVFLFLKALNSAMALLKDHIRFGGGDALVKGVVAHHDRRGAAAGEAFDKFDRKLPVLGRLRSEKDNMGWSDWEKLRNLTPNDKTNLQEQE